MTKNSYQRLSVMIIGIFFILGIFSVTFYSAEAKRGIFLANIKKAAPSLLLTANTLDVTPGSGVVSGEVEEDTDNVPSLSIKLTAGRKDLYVKKITLAGFYDQNGDSQFGLNPGYEVVNGTTYYLNSLIDSVKLYAQNGRQIGSTRTVPASGLVSFSNVDLFMAKNSIQDVIVKVDLKDTQYNNNQKFYFDIQKETDIYAESARIPKQVKVNDGDGNYTDVFVGPNKFKNVVITVKPEDNTSSAQIRVITNNLYADDTIVFPGTDYVEGGSFRFEPFAEDVRIDQMTLRVEYVQTGSGSIMPVDRVLISYPTTNNPEIYDGSAIAYPNADGYTYFTDINFYAKKYQAVPPSSVKIYTDIKDDAKSLKIRFNFIGDANSNFHGTGITTGETYTEANVDNANNNRDILIYQTKPYFSTITNLNGCPSTNFNFGANTPIYCFSARADGRQALDLDKVTVKYQTSGIATGSTRLFSLYDYFNQTSPISTVALSGSGAQTSLGFVFYSPMRIYEGQSRHFIVKGPVQPDGTGRPATITTKLFEDTYSFPTGRRAADINNGYQTTWSDLSEPNHSLNTNDWFTGYGLETLPTEQLILNGNAPTSITVTLKQNFDETVVPGTNFVDSAGYIIKPTGENIRIEQLTFRADYGGINSGNNVLPDAIRRVVIRYPTRLEDQGNLDGYAETTLTGSGYANFTNLTFLASKSQNATPEVAVRIDIKDDAPTSNVRLNFVGDATSNFRAVGLESGQIFNESAVNNVNTPNRTYIFQSKPNFATITNFNNCPTETLSFGNEVPVYCFEVRANENGPIDLFKATVNYRTTGIATGSTMIFNLYDIFNQNQPLASFNTQGWRTNLGFQFLSPQRVLEGTTRYFIVKGPVQPQNPGNPQEISTIRAQVMADIYTYSSGKPANFLFPSHQTVWSDISAENHDAWTNDWFTGYALETLPTIQLYLHE